MEDPNRPSPMTSTPESFLGVRGAFCVPLSGVAKPVSQ